MARNLCCRVCYFCGDTPELLEPAHKITRKEAGVYFEEYEGMTVAKAKCPSCLAIYLAWLDESKRKNYATPNFYDEGEINDLSFYSTFNDEAGLDDLPVYKIETTISRKRIGPYI